LWDRTVAAIEAMLQERKVESEYLFLNSFNRPTKEATIRKWWTRQREITQIAKSVKFEHIRDATQTIPLDDDPRSLVETHLIMGHSVKGMANNYLERRPTMVRRACAAIEAYFFGKDENSEEKKS
jgi:integrase